MASRLAAGRGPGVRSRAYIVWVVQTNTDADQDWRLQAALEGAEAGGRLPAVVGRVRGSDTDDMVKEMETAAPLDVVVTHDGKLLFAYAPDEPTLAQARRAIEAVLAREGIAASFRVSRWDDDLGEWLQTDPPPGAEELARTAAAARDAETVETRTLVASSGRLIRGEFEQVMEAWADRLGLECGIIEHPHLLTTQIAFTVKGPRRKLDEFASGLKAEEWRTIRTETAVMTSPL